MNLYNFGTKQFHERYTCIYADSRYQAMGRRGFKAVCNGFSVSGWEMRKFSAKLLRFPRARERKNTEHFTVYSFELAIALEFSTVRISQNICEHMEAEKNLRV